jgi:hypothetical protein
MGGQAMVNETLYCGCANSRDIDIRGCEYSPAVKLCNAAKPDVGAEARVR